jgi:hypothetical protein
LIGEVARQRAAAIPGKPPVEPGEEQLQDARRSFGDDHPQTLVAMLDLAEAFWVRGRLIAARKNQVVARPHVLNRLVGHSDLFGDTVVGPVWGVFKLSCSATKRRNWWQVGCRRRVLFLRANARFSCSDNPARTMVDGGSLFLRSRHAR